MRPCVLPFRHYRPRRLLFPVIWPRTNRSAGRKTSEGVKVRKLRVAVLMGGTSTERAISLSTGRQILSALDPDKYCPMALDAAAISGGRSPELPPAVAINALQNAGAPPSTDLAPLSLSQLAS